LSLSNQSEGFTGYRFFQCIGDYKRTHIINNGNDFCGLTRLSSEILLLRFAKITVLSVLTISGSVFEVAVTVYRSSIPLAYKAK